MLLPGGLTGVYTDVADFTCSQMTNRELHRASRLPAAPSIEKDSCRIGLLPHDDE